MGIELLCPEVQALLAGVYDEAYRQARTVVIPGSRIIDVTNSNVRDDFHVESKSQEQQVTELIWKSFDGKPPAL
jgi:hypothetical protein